MSVEISDTDAAWQSIIEVAARSDLFANQSGAPIPEMQQRLGPGLIFRGSQGGVSRRSAPARAGWIYKATTTLVVQGEGPSPPVHFGPMFLDTRDGVLVYSSPVPVEALDVEQRIEFIVTAPAGAVAVRLRMVGGWASDLDSSRLRYTYGKAQLFRKIG
ncbi:MAG: hypothetical protein ABMA14_24250 [Hyphomonadaceae bacterium]